MKIAVCISGRMSGFDVTSKLFEHWNSIYDNVEFYFFISTWKDVSSEYSETRGPVEDWDFSKYKFITKYEKVDINDAWASEKCLKVSACYSYSLYRAQQLRRECKEEFDGVIQTRSDMFIDRQTLDSLINLIDKQGELSKKIFYSPSNLRYEDKRFMLIHDYFGFAHPKVMDIYSLMYFDAHIINLVPTAFHYMNGTHLVNRNIQVICIPGVGLTSVIPQTFKEIHKWRMYDAISSLIEKRGVEWIFYKKRKIEELIKELKSL
ncbi:hypothetical protein CMI38_00045 [Candidatus Pacearchaeota archaeon]|nr:hypothetical protein [Candidatus Pacearchaeota archaeon]